MFDTDITKSSAAGSGILSKLKHLGRERIALAFGSAVMFFLIFSSLRTNYIQGISPGRFWMMKLSWCECADMVLAGNSRVYRGLSPAQMQNHLPSMRIYNYAFSGQGFSDSYLQALEKVLDKNAPRKIIVLGIGPHALTKNSVEKNGYQKYAGMAFRERLVCRYLAYPLRWFRPLSPREIQNFIHWKVEKFYQHFHADGWIESWMEPEDPQRDISLARKKPPLTDPNRIISQTVMDNLIETVAKWRALEIEVYGFRTPVGAELSKLQNYKTKYDEEGFIERFEEAGGKWLSINPDDYHRYDGSHLNPESALTLSRDLARLIKESDPPDNKIKR
ncbi:hypothetical protein ACFL02_01840 [Planctomycetota bacterium]